MWCLVWSMYNALKVLVWVSKNLEWEEKNIKDTSIIFLNTIQMCQKATKMYQLVRRQRSMESSHITDRVAGRDCNGLQAWRKKKFRTKIILKIKKITRGETNLLKIFTCSIFFFLIFFTLIMKILQIIFIFNPPDFEYIHNSPRRWQLWSLWEERAPRLSWRARDKRLCLEKPVRTKHCQRQNGPEGWVLLTKVISWGHITNSYTNLDQTYSESRPSTNFKISTKHQHFDKT